MQYQFSTELAARITAPVLNLVGAHSAPGSSAAPTPFNRGSRTPSDTPCLTPPIC